jgi:hypothetical protein
MIKKIVFSLPLLFLIQLLFNAEVSSAESSDAQVNGSSKIYYELGKQSQTDITEERDLSGNFNFYRYGVKAAADFKGAFGYRLAYENYQKDFEAPNNSLDTIADLYNFSLGLPISKTENFSLDLDADYELRTKRYKNNTPLEYDENSLSCALLTNYGKRFSLGIGAGLKDYEYIKKSSSDYDKYWFKVSPGIKILDECLSVSAYYKRQMVDKPKEDSDYNEDTASVKTALKTNMPVLYKISAFFEEGRNDTQDDEEDREDNLRFKYTVWDIASNYKIYETLDTQLTYGQKYRGYNTSINGYDNWFIKDKTEINIIKKTPYELDILAGIEHKETSFYQNSSLGYNKNFLSGGFNILKRGDWSLRPDFSFTKYKYPPLSVNNQKTYRAVLNFKKYIRSTDNAAEVDWQYKWKDYRYKADIQQWSLKLSLSIKF